MDIENPVGILYALTSDGIFFLSFLLEVLAGKSDENYSIAKMSIAMFDIFFLYTYEKPLKMSHFFFNLP
jgi:hypothetical protein